MLDRVLSLFSGHHSPAQTYAPAGSRNVLRMVNNDRMAGGVPSWRPAESAQQEIELALSTAQQSAQGTTNSQALGYSSDVIATTPEQEFGFADLVDIINPLQHIPVVGHLYRNITGDEIKPVTQILGDGIFAGPIGLAGGLVNLIVEKETGKDITGNALAMFTDGQMPRLVKHDQPEMPASLLSFADLSHDTAQKIIWNEPKPRVWAGND